jgi:hypothetical protein
MPVPHGWNQPIINQRLEDLRWMADTGENASGAAARLGITFNALEVWLRRHDTALWKRLVAREPRDENHRTKQHGVYRTAGREAS